MSSDTAILSGSYKKSITLVTIYILQCADNTYYTGITKNLGRRLSEHNRGKSKSTRDRLPIKLLHTETVTGYKIAAMIERKIKNVGAKKSLIRRMNYNEI